MLNPTAAAPPCIFSAIVECLESLLSIDLCGFATIKMQIGTGAKFEICHTRATESRTINHMVGGREGAEIGEGLSSDITVVPRSLGHQPTLFTPLRH